MGKSWLTVSLMAILQLCLINMAEARTAYIFRYLHGGAGVLTEQPIPVFSMRIDGRGPFTVGQIWTATAIAEGIPAGPVRYMMSAGPSWLSINANTGVIVGTPPAAGPHGEAVFVASDGVVTKEISLIVVASDPLQVQKIPDILQFPDATIDKKIEVSGGAGSYSFKWNKDHDTQPPAWLHLSEDKGELTGLAEEGVWDLSIEVSDRDGRKEYVDLKVDVIRGTNWFTYLRGGSLQAQQMALGPNGEAFISGTINSSPTKTFIAKVDDEGIVEWIRTIEMPLSAQAFGLVAKNGSIYLSGTVIDDGGSGRRFLIAKYSQFGTREWLRAITSSGDGQSIAVGDDGSVVVVGSNYSIAKMSANGVVLWSRNFGGMGNDARAVTIDGSGGIYVGGMTYNGGNGQGDVLLAKLDENGQKIWARTFGGPLMEYISSLTIGSDGALYGTGYTSHAGDMDILAVKFTTSGNPLWYKRIGMNPGQDIGHHIVSVGDGSVYIAGEATVGRSSDHEAVFVQLSPSGQIMRARRFGNVLTDRAYGIAATPRGTVYLSGVSTAFYDEGGTPMALVARLSPQLPKTDNLPASVQYRDVLFGIYDVNFGYSDRPGWNTSDLGWSATSLDRYGSTDGGLTFQNYSFE
ncbi:hypothetical protein [Mesorhizobium sp. SP-1A]|uniref:hypothetical protein n=1 Tax=Mesorhizobium sp. SP-1A TaxID=3077840 RepID=UPI0028F73C29|nr:hypothetical protein [Mesorhizobium sp. SP-1A]